MGLGVELGLVIAAGAGEDAEKASGDERVSQVPQESSGIIVERGSVLALGLTRDLGRTQEQRLFERARQSGPAASSTPGAAFSE